MNEPYRLRYTNQIVGGFLLILILFLIVLALLLIRASDYFVEQKTFYFDIAQEQVKDLHPGIDVMILGQRAGQIESIDYVEDSDRVRIKLSIDPDKSDQIFTNSVVVPDRKYGVGTPVLNIRRATGNDGVPTPLLPGTQISTFRSEDDRIERMSREVESVSASVRLIQQKLDPTLEQTRIAAGSFYESNEQLRPDASETLRVIREATLSMQSEIGVLTAKIENLIDTDMRDTLAHVQRSTDEVSAAAATTNQTSSRVGDDIAETLAKIELAAEKVQLLAEESRQVIRIVRREAEDLPGTTARVNDTVSETQDLVGEIRDHWLLRRSINRNVPTQQISPSTVRGGLAR